MKIIAQSQNSSFADKITKEKSLVYDLRVVMGGEKRYFIIKIIPSKHNAFMQAIKTDSGLRLEDYGNILHRGWNEPDDELKQSLRQQYGLYENAA